MLLKFKFKNFKSFRDEVCLDLTATKITEFSDRNFEVGNIKVLPAASIFGANASGKSNVIDAFRFMRKYIIDSLYEMAPDRQESNGRRRTKVMPFFFDDKIKNDNSMFEVYFVLTNDESEKIYRYGFEVNENIVKEEWLSYRAKTSREDFKTIYYRNEKEIDWKGVDTKISKNIEASLRENVLIMTLGTILNEPLLTKIFRLFRETNVINFGDPEEDYYIYLGAGYTRYILEEKNQEEVKKYLGSFDSSIVGISAERHLAKVLGQEDEIHVYVHHKKNNSDEIVKLPMIFESAGTQKMFYLYTFFKGSLMTGNAILIDELNSKLHPLLIRNIVQMYLNNDINKLHAQLIFTSHDVWQLKSDTMRRDEIWFTEKDEKGVSNLYSLSDFIDKDGDKIRKDGDHLKNYIHGKYGAIPSLNGFEGVFN